MTKVILLVGPAGSGKTTVSEEIRAQLQSVATVAFADPVKEFLQLVFDVSPKILWGPSSLREKKTVIDWQVSKERLQRHGPPMLRATLEIDLHAKAQKALDEWFDSISGMENPTVRFLLQSFGTEWGRAQDEDIWARYCTRGVRRYVSSGYFRAVVITDGRHPNEVLEVKGMKDLPNEPEVWFMERTGKTKKWADQSLAQHSSETEIEKCRKLATYVLNNNVRMEILPWRVSKLLK